MCDERKTSADHRRALAVGPTSIFANQPSMIAGLRPGGGPVMPARALPAAELTSRARLVEEQPSWEMPHVVDTAFRIRAHPAPGLASARGILRRPGPPR